MTVCKPYKKSEHAVPLFVMILVDDSYINIYKYYTQVI